MAALQRLFWELDADAAACQPEHFVQAPRPEAYLLEIIVGERSDFIVADLDGCLVGFALLMEREMGGISCLLPCRYAYLQDFVVAAAWRNQGYGTALFQAAQAWARARGLAYLRLSVFPQNEGAIRFYARQGLHANMITMECPLAEGDDSQDGRA